MVNVNKNIVSGNTGASEKSEPALMKRRPRNQALNSSKKTVSVTHGETHATEQNPFKAKLNCSRKLNCSVTGDITSDVYDKLYTREDDPQKVADVLGCTVEDVKEIDSETEDLGYGKTVGYLLAKPEYEEELSQNGIEILSILEDGTVGMMVGHGFHTVETDLELVLNRVDEDLDGEETEMDSACSGKSDIDSACGNKSELNSAADEKLDGVITLYDDFAKITEIDVEKLLKERVSKMVPGVDISLEKINDTQIKVSGDCPEDDATRVKLAIESSDVTKSVDWDSKEAELDSSTKTTEKVEDDETAKDATEEVQKLNCSDEEVEDKVVVTESGNEISIKEIKVVQNPSTNELALYVPENEDDEIPEGFVVLGDVVATAAAEAPEEEVKEEFKENVEEEEPEEGELDASKKKN